MHATKATNDRRADTSQETPVTMAFFRTPGKAKDRRTAGLVVPLILLGVMTTFHGASAGQDVAEGQKLAFDRGKGNCLTCHEIKGGTLAGNIGPALTDIKSKYPDRNELVAIVSDETKRNPQTVMPPFGRNHILTDKEINAVVDFLQTL
jgi:sulfur-oxidizing protein SoxX